MKRIKINLLFLLIPVLAYFLFAIYTSLNKGASSFFGVAENQETEINLEHDCSVTKIHVTEGEFVTKGTLLLEANGLDLDIRMSELKYDIAEVTAQDRLNQDEIRGNLQQLKALRAEKAGEIMGEIRILQSEKMMNEQLFSELKSIPATDTVKTASVYEATLASLKEELRLVVEPIDAEIARLEKELRSISGPAKAEVTKMEKEIEFYAKEKEKLKIYAPTDGLVGGVHCKVGENIPSFDPLISFYEQSPNAVVAYIHESLSTKLKVGDSIHVASTLHPEEVCVGEVRGLGHRIVEIPERLRKIPEIKTYGREVLIHIPSENNFLQKEKVMLHHVDESPFSVVSFLQKPFSSSRTKHSVKE